MKNSILVIFLLIFGCAHSPYENLSEIKVGSDKEEVLNKIGSPLRTRRQDGQDIWTYRFYQDSGYIYKDIILEKQKVVHIEESKQVKIEEIERKEKQIEQALLKEKREVESRTFEKKSPKKSPNTDFLDQDSQPSPAKFEPVE